MAFGWLSPGATSDLCCVPSGPAPACTDVVETSDTGNLEMKGHGCLWGPHDGRGTEGGRWILFPSFKMHLRRLEDTSEVAPVTRIRNSTKARGSVSPCSS